MTGPELPPEVDAQVRAELAEQRARDLATARREAVTDVVLERLREAVGPPR